MVELFANSEDPDQMPCSVASDLGLHCLPITLLGVSRLQWVKHHASIKHYLVTATELPPWNGQTVLWGKGVERR